MPPRHDTLPAATEADSEASAQPKRDVQRHKVAAWVDYRLRPMTDDQPENQMTIEDIRRLVGGVCQDYQAPMLEVYPSASLTSTPGQITFRNRYQAAWRGIAGPVLTGHQIVPRRGFTWGRNRSGRFRFLLSATL